MKGGSLTFDLWYNLWKGGGLSVLQWPASLSEALTHLSQTGPHSLNGREEEGTWWCHKDTCWPTRVSPHYFDRPVSLVSLVNKPSVPAFRSGTEWNQVTFSMNEASNTKKKERTENVNKSNLDRPEKRQKCQKNRSGEVIVRLQQKLWSWFWSFVFSISKGSDCSHRSVLGPLRWSWEGGGVGVGGALAPPLLGPYAWRPWRTIERYLGSPSGEWS